MRRSSAPRPCVRHETTGPNPEQWRAPTVTIDQRANFQMDDSTYNKLPGAKQVSEITKQLTERLRNELLVPQYTVEAGCFNCGVNSAMKVEKGVLLGNVECPNCGCKSLIAKL